MVDIKRDIQQRVGDELADVGLVDVPIEYHMTSIFDHSIFEAFSKIIQKLIPQLHTLQDLLNNLVDVHTWSCTTKCRLRIYKRRFCLM
jgi:Ras-related GTP-binding protein C/D